MNILFEDKHILVAQKSADTVSEALPDGSGFADEIAARNAENGHYVGIIHRLDRGVGGVMVYAKTPAAAAKLSAAVQANALIKEYLAVVHGVPAEPEGEMRDLLFHDKRMNKTFVVDRERAGVKEARLSYRVAETYESTADGGRTERFSLVRIRLHTGRTHQIRVQFSTRGMPLCGDRKYGARDRGAILLFSERLTFPHPVTGKVMTFSATPPWIGEWKSREK